MLIDEIEAEFSGGHGGPGKMSFFRKGRGPDGGNGGRGGDLYFKTTSDVYALTKLASHKSYSASPGAPGRSNRQHGLTGESLTILVPAGTDVIDQQTGQVLSLNKVGEEVLVCKGGLGGLGNAELRSSIRTTPIYAQPGLSGQVRHLKCVLKLIADVGLVGLPNSGKSSLLNALTTAKAKVGDYSFTTLEPNLGVCGDKVIADIPGLVEGASHGKGLGLKFLKHVEKVPIIFHCLAADSKNLKGDYETIRKEMGEYNKELLTKNETLLITKKDLVTDELLKRTIKEAKKISQQVIAVSILDDASLENLRSLILKSV